MKITINNKPNYQKIWIGNKTYELFKDFKDVNNNYINLFPIHHNFVPHYNGNSKMLDLMKSELNNNDYIIGEIKNEFKLKALPNNIFEFEIFSLSDIVYALKFNTKIKSFDIQYNNNSNWDSIYNIDDFNHDVIPILPNLTPYPCCATPKTKLKIIFTPDSSKSINVFSLIGLFSDNKHKLLSSFTGNLGYNMVINNNEFNIY